MEADIRAADIRKDKSPEHFVIENIWPDKMLWRCEAVLRNAREIGAGGPP
jgi:hypothetical protein